MRITPTLIHPLFVLSYFLLMLLVKARTTILFQASYSAGTLPDTEAEVR